MRRVLILALAFSITLGGCAAMNSGSVTHRVTVAQHSLLSVVGAFEEAESAEFAKGFVPPDLHLKMQTGVEKVALAAKDLDTALATTGVTNATLKTKLDAIYALLDSLNSDGILGVKNASTKAILEIALDQIKVVIDQALTQVQ